MPNMLDYLPPSGDPGATEHSVTPQAIAERARELWLAQGCPENCDEAIWLEAEAELIAIQQKRFRHPHLQLNPQNGYQSERALRHAQ
jgi:hypothetical protein